MRSLFYIVHDKKGNTSNCRLIDKQTKKDFRARQKKGGEKRVKNKMRIRKDERKNNKRKETNKRNMSIKITQFTFNDGIFLSKVSAKNEKPRKIYLIFYFSVCFCKNLKIGKADKATKHKNESTF